MIRSAENSLRSLKVDVIDILQLHGISTEGEVTDGRAREALQKLIDQGRSASRGSPPTAPGGRAAGRPKARFYKTVWWRTTSAPTRASPRRSGAPWHERGLSNTIRSVAESGVGVIG